MSRKWTKISRRIPRFNIEGVTFKIFKSRDKKHSALSVSELQLRDFQISKNLIEIIIFRDLKIYRDFRIDKSRPIKYEILISQIPNLRY